MQIKCRTENLQYAVQTVQKAVASRTTLPILTGIYLAADDGSLNLQATDYEVGISANIPATINTAGRTVLSSRYFSEIVRRLPGEEVEIAAKNSNTVQITSGAATYHLVTMPPEEFPVLKKSAGENHISLPARQFRDAIRQTVFACASDDSRPVFTGALLELTANELNLVATDTHRLALLTTKLEGPAHDNNQMIVPARMLAELARVLPAQDENMLAIDWQKSQIIFAYDDIFMTSRLIEGQYPDYRRVIPAEYTVTAILSTSGFLQAVERASLLTREGNYNVVKFKFDDAGMTVHAHNADVGQAVETVPARVTGGELEIAFNARYISDMLKIVDKEEVVFSLNTSLSPACIKGVGDDQYTYIVTPVRTVD